MKPILVALLGIGLIAAFAGCGGGSYDDTTIPPASTLVKQEINYPDGLVQETGAVQTGTSIREGEWWGYYDASSSTPTNGIYQKPQWRKWFRQGQWIQTEPWREWNQDGSIRDDYTDGLTSLP